MGTFDNLRDKAEQAAADHPEQAEKFSDQAIERGGDAADKASGGKYAQQMDKGEDAADKKIGQ